MCLDMCNDKALYIRICSILGCTERFTRLMDDALDTKVQRRGRNFWAGVTVKTRFLTKELVYFFRTFTY